jgi:hypothetical protein
VLNAVAHVDMALRGLAVSRTPERSVEAIAGSDRASRVRAGKTRDNRLTGFEALSGIAIGVGLGAVLGGLRAVVLRLPSLAGAPLVGAAAIAFLAVGVLVGFSLNGAGRSATASSASPMATGGDVCPFRTNPSGGQLAGLRSARFRARARPQFVRT